MSYFTASKIAELSLFVSKIVEKPPLMAGQSNFLIIICLKALVSARLMTHIVRWKAGRTYISVHPGQVREEAAKAVFRGSFSLLCI